MNAPGRASTLATAALPAAAHAAGWRAELELAFARRHDCTVLVRRRHFGPLRVQKALYPEGGAVCHAIMLHPPAGIVGGDTLAIDVSVGAAAHALLTTPGAGKWYRSGCRSGYRSGGPRAALTQTIRVATGGVCEWLPQESIVFDGARGDLVTEVALAADAHFVGMEMLCFGRTACGERYAHGDLTMRTRVSVEGRPVWLERGLVRGGDALLDAAVGLGGHPVAGTLLIVGPAAEAALRDACRLLTPAAGEGALTLLPGVLVARYRGPACEPGRLWFAQLWACARPALAGLPMRVPRIWNT